MTAGHIPETHRAEYDELSPSERELVTQQAITRRADKLDDRDYSLRDVARLERARRATLRTIRSGAELTDQEWRLMRYLQRHEGQVRTYVQLAHALWGTPSKPITARALRAMDLGTYAIPMITTIQGYVHQIRKKLEIDPLRPQHLANARGVGYTWYDRPPSLDDGVNYEKRATEHEKYRRAMEIELGLIEGRPGIVDVDEPTSSDRLGLGPSHPDYHEGAVTRARSERERNSRHPERDDARSGEGDA